MTDQINFPLKLANFLVNLPKKIREFTVVAVPPGLISALVYKIETGELSKKEVLQALEKSYGVWETEVREDNEKMYEKYPIGSIWKIRENPQAPWWQEHVLTIKSLYKNEFDEIVAICSSPCRDSDYRFRTEWLRKTE